MNADVVLPTGGAGKVVPRGIGELVEYAVGIGHAVVIPDIPSVTGFDRDVAYILERLLKESAEVSAAIVRNDAGKKIAGPALQVAIYAYRLAQYAMMLEERRLLVAASQSQ